MQQRFILYPILALAILILAACGGSTNTAPSSQAAPTAAVVEAEAAAPAGDAEAGKQIFTATCGACHGPAGEGVVGLGKDMTTSEFIAGKSDEELVEFIKVGRDPSDPLNTTGVAMPVKGGNPALDDEDLFNVVAFIRTIHK